MKLLFVPWGRGMGHMTRCLAIAAQASRSQDQAVIVAEERWDSLAKQAGCTRLSYPQELVSVGIWKEWENVDHVRRSLSADLRILEQVKPDIVVHDQRPTMPMACELAGIPYAALAQRTDLPDFFYEGLASFQTFWNNCKPAFNTVLSENGLPLLQNNWRDLNFRNPILIPSIPAFDPLPAATMGPEVWYTGPLHLNRDDVVLVPDFESRPEVPIIFVYGVIQTQQDLDQLIHTFHDGSFHLVIAALPPDVHVSQQTEHLRNISIYDFVNVPTFLPKCDVAIIHGGHGSCTAVLAAGIPAVVLVDSSPLELERTSNGKRLQEMGVALCVSYDDISSKLYDTVKRLLSESTYYQAAKRWQKHLRVWNGPKTAWEILTKAIGGRK